MSKQNTKKGSRRFVRWCLGLGWGWRIAFIVLALTGTWVAVRYAVGKVKYVVEEIAGDHYYVDEFLGNGYEYRNYYGRYYALARSGKLFPLVKHVDWVVGNDEDSLWVVSREGRRSYFNTGSGRLLSPFVYRHAWVFSEGVAAVVDTADELSFITPDGQPGCPVRFRYREGHSANFVFHRGLCPMVDTAGRAGLIDRAGRWVLEPRYDSIYYTAGFWALLSTDSLAAADSTGRLLVGMTPGHRLQVTEAGNLEFWHRTRPARLYAPDGRLIARQVYWSISNLCYYDGDPSGYNTTSKYSGLMVYSTDESHRGLVDLTGRVLTDAVYDEITALSTDVFSAQFRDDAETGYSTAFVLLNRKGEFIPQP